MSEQQTQKNKLTQICTTITPSSDHTTLLEAVAQLYPDLSFSHGLTRDGWHRIGGVVTPEQERVTTSLRQWAETSSDHDMFALYETYGASDYATTRLDGKTHYFYASTGKRAPDFIQLEVEELIELVDHPLFIDDQIPDDIEELLAPPDARKARLQPKVLTQPHYLFRELTDVDELVADQVTSEGSDLRYIRFLEEWDRSSAGSKTRFCDHFVLRQLPFKDRFGERKIEATPLPIDDLPLADESFETLSGTSLANFLQDYDKDAGFPMAWYFAMLINKKAMIAIAQAVYLDHQRNYRYLPDRDLSVLEGWIGKPYSF